MDSKAQTKNTAFTIRPSVALRLRLVAVGVALPFVNDVFAIYLF